MSVLLLNASYEALGFVSWKRAIVLVLTDRAELVEQEPDRVIRSAGGNSYPFPVVVRLVAMVRNVRRGKPAPFNRRNLDLRDSGACQVKGCSSKGATVDHLLPRSHGGDSNWHNCVLMCHHHNGAKGDKTLEQLGWRLKQKPHAPAATLVLATRAASRPEWGRWIVA